MNTFEAAELLPRIPLTRYRIVERVSSEHASMTATVRLMPENVVWDVVFSSLVGYRVFDERDFLSYWPACSQGTVFEVLKGGWLDTPGFEADVLLSGFYGVVREFFVAGEDQCVSVLATEEPSIAQCN